MHGALLRTASDVGVRFMTTTGRHVLRTLLNNIEQLGSARTRV